MNELPHGAWTIDELPQVSPPDDPQYPPVAQTELEGEWFVREVTQGNVHQGEHTARFPGTRKVRVVAGTGGLGNEFETLDETQTDPTILPKHPLTEARVSRAGGMVYDRADDAHRSLETVLRHGASRTGTKVELKPGAIPGYQIVKPATSFGSSVVGKQIEDAINAANQLLLTRFNN